MTILNIMLGKGRGGLEQAAVDYAEALTHAEIKNLTLIAPRAWVEPSLVTANLPHETIANVGGWDIFAAARLRKLAMRVGARAAICHGNRAVSLALMAFHQQPNMPNVIAVTHNYSTRRFVKADRCFAITHRLVEHLRAQGITDISYMPNMVRVRTPAPRPTFRSPPVIGAMGRLVHKKGFKSLIGALAILHTRGVAFRAVIGGDGEEAPAIDALITQHQLLGDIVTRIGWVQDKSAFFEAIDIFVLPSKHEAFGIVLIEAMNHGVPVISTESEGPREIIHPNHNGVLVPVGDPNAMADAMQQLLANPAQAATISANASRMVTEKYSMEAMASRLQTALTPYI